MEANVRVKFINHTEKIVCCELNRTIEIKPGDFYAGKRNTGWELGKAKEIVNGYIVPEYGPILDMIYTYNIEECAIVECIYLI